MANEIITRAEARALGRTRYFSGKPCKRGHYDERVVSSDVCCQCNREAARRAYKPHPRRALTPEERRAYKAAWYVANRDRIAAKRAENPGKYREINIASAKAWVAANPDRAREHGRLHARKRRAQKHGSNGTHTAADLSEILAAQGHRCAYCRANLKRVKKHVDHIKPLALGGSNGRENLQYLCAPCNQSKSAKDPVDYAKSIGLLI